MDLSNVIQGADDISALIDKDHDITSQFANTSTGLADQINSGRKYSNLVKEDEKALAEIANAKRTQSIIDAVNIAGQSNNTQVNVTLEGDAAGVFRLVRQENRRFIKSTGYAPLA